MNPTPLVDVRHLNYAYPDGRTALCDIEFAIAASESVALIGPNGAGKSTLLLHLNGVLPERRGIQRQSSESVNGVGVWIAGLDMSTRNLPTIRRTVGLVFQDPDDQLFCSSVIEDVAFGPLNRGDSADRARQLAQEALEAVGLVGFEDRIPSHLSMGERKRVCLAGVLACEPSVLALDEPTSNLDPRGRRHFIDLLRSLPMTKIIATHDLEMVLDLCDRVLVLDESRLQADGPVHQIMSDEALLHRHGLELPLSLKLRREA